jgi:hypothetical protein
MASKQTFITDQGVAVYPWLNKPDTKFDPDGTYKTGIRVNSDDAQSLIKSMRQMAVDEFGKKGEVAKLPFQVDEDTGDIIFNAKSKYQPKMVDSMGEVIDPKNRPQVWGGSIIRVKGAMNPYQAAGNIGISLQLSAVQIIELSEGESNGDNTFDAVEGGFIASKMETASGSNEAAGQEQDWNF